MTRKVSINTWLTKMPKGSRFFIVLSSLLFVFHAACAAEGNIELISGATGSAANDGDLSNGVLNNSDITINLEVSNGIINTYVGNISLGAISNITVSAAIDKANTAGNITFGAGMKNILKANIKTKGNQLFKGDINLDTVGIIRLIASAGTITFEDKIDGTVEGKSSLVVSGSTTVFNKAVGSQTSLKGLFTAQTAIIKGGSVKTTGKQEYNKLILDSTLLSGGVATTSLESTTGTVRLISGVTSKGDGVNHLIILGNAELFGKIGAGTGRLKSLKITGNSEIFDNEIRTKDDQEYVGEVTLAKNAILTSSTGTVIFRNKLTSKENEQRNLDITGNVYFLDQVGVDPNVGIFPDVGQAITNRAIGKLTVTGSAVLGGRAIFTTANQTYGAPVTITKNNIDIISSEGITFNSTLDSGLNGAVDPEVTIKSTFGTVFNGAVGKIDPLENLSVTGVAKVNGGFIETIGAQDYDAVILNSAANKTELRASSITFLKKIDGTLANIEELKIQATDTVLFEEAVGANKALKSLDISAKKINLAESIITNGRQNYGGDVFISGGVNNILRGTDITFDKKLNSLGINATGLEIVGNASFGDNVGNGVGVIQSLNITGTTRIAANKVIATSQLYKGAVTLSAGEFSKENDDFITVHILTGEDIIFSNKVDDDDVLLGQRLVIEGDVLFLDKVGSISSLSSLKVTGKADVKSTIVTTGDQTYNKLRIQDLGKLKATNGKVRYEELKIGNSPGSATIDADLDLFPSAISFFELGGLSQGTEYDYLHVTGTASIAGDLSVSLIDLGLGAGQFAPPDGSYFDLLTADSISGEFSKFLPTQIPGYILDLQYLLDDNGVDVLRLTATQAVPVPASIWLLGSGLIGLAGVARERKKGTKKGDRFILGNV